MQHDVGLSYVPAICERRRSRQVLRVTFLRSAVDPRCDRIDLRLRKSSIISELLEVRISVPRRHLLGDNLLLNRARPGPCVLVTQQGHGRGFAWSMTLDTVLEEDGSNVPREGDLFLRA